MVLVEANLERVWTGHESGLRNAVVLKQEKPVTNRLSTSLYAITTPYQGAYVHSFVAVGETAVVVDTGLKWTGEAILALLESLGSPRVLATVHTHGHWDHIGSAFEIREKTGCLNAAHAADAEMICCYEENDRRFLKMFAEFPPADGEVTEIYAAIGPQAHVDLRLAGGESFDLGKGIVLDIVPMPGHTPGCIGIFERESRSLISGDALAGRGPFGTLVQYEDVAAYKQTIERIRSLGPKRILAAHLEPIEGPAINEFLDDCLDEVNVVGEHVSTAASDSIDLITIGKRISRSLGKGFRLQTLMTAQAHLDDMRTSR